MSEKKRNTMYVTNPETGIVEEVDVVTGEVLGQALPGSYREVELSTGGNALVPSGSGVEGKRSPHIPYSREVIAVICEELIRGENLTDILSRPGYPNAMQLTRWRRAYPECDEEILLALEMRAELYADKVFKEVEALDPETAKKSETEARKLRIDQYWKRASFDNRRRFQDSVKHDHEHKGEVATKIVLDLGVRLPGDPGYIIDETAKIRARQELEQARDQEQLQKLEEKEVIELEKVSGPESKKE